MCSRSEIEKNGKCYIRRKPGEACEYSEQCQNIGDIEYYCIANVCQEPPECPPGFVSMGAECLPYSVTGGPCIHPSQCLTGSVCIKGKCRGPCDFNQLFLEESCVDYGNKSYFRWCQEIAEIFVSIIYLDLDHYFNNN
jgi:hypothetical protein